METEAAARSSTAAKACMVGLVDVAGTVGGGGRVV